MKCHALKSFEVRCDCTEPVDGIQRGFYRHCLTCDHTLVIHYVKTEGEKKVKR